MSHGRPSPVAPGQRSQNFSASFRKLLGRLRPTRWHILLALVATTFSVLLSVAAPRILGQATDLIFTGVISKLIAQSPSRDAAVAALNAQGNENLAQMLSSMDVIPGAGIDFAALGRVLLTVIALYVASSLLSYVAGLTLRTAVQRAGRRMRQQVQDKIESLPLSYLDRHSRGDLMSRVSNDVDNTTQVLNQTLSQFFQSILTIIGIVAMMLAMSWKLTLVALLIVPAGLAVAGVMMGKAQPQFRRQWESTGQVSSLVEESISGHDVMVLYGLEDQYSREFGQANDRLYRSSFIAQFVSNLIMPIMTLISNMSYVVVAVGGAIMVSGGSMSLGQVQAFIQYSRQFSQPIGQLASMVTSLQSGVASAERVFEFLEADELAEDTGDAHLENVRGHIVFDHVRFGYTPDRTIIHDLSLDVRPGQMVAIIGPTGAGKTTLVNLLMRFYELDSGSITIDGVDIRDLPRDELRSHIGMVLQETWLFDGTIADNIAFGREGATRENVYEAARATGADRLIRHLPDGYDTHVSDESTAISLGERQLITIARAFISQPDLLILDEATSSVDTRTEVLVHRAMDRLREGRTAFVIAHRLSTIRDADVILVMEEGDVVEMGTHDELLARQGAYARLYQSQFSAPDDHSDTTGDAQ